MARVVAADATLTVHLSAFEKLAALSGDVTVPLSSVRQAAVEPRPWGALRGVRSPGTGLPWLMAYGTRRHHGGRDFTAVVGGRPTLRIDLDPARAPYGRLTVSVNDAQATLREIARARAR